MGKPKNSRTAAKRFKVTGSGKFMYRSAMNHLRRHKSASRLRRLKAPKVIDEPIWATFKICCPGHRRCSENAC